MKKRWTVRQFCPLRRIWEVWVIYDEKQHADNECARRIAEARPCDKSNWKVMPE